uniref:Retrotransposon gag protein n=1 Tax=Quercus lobata TaxID=97700 RepID=A0A7N2MMI3_QUELO
MAEGGEHPNTKEPMNTQELLNTMVASQLQLREDMNLMVQQFQNLKGGQEENKTDHTSPTMEGEKKINERINKVEEMIQRARKMEDLMDYQSFSLLPDVRLPLKFKMSTLDKFDGTGCPKSHLKMYMRVMQPLGATEELLAQMFQNTLTGPLLGGSST